MDLVQLTRNPPPPNVDYVFFLTIVVIFQFLDIIFTLKVKKIREKWT